MTPTGIVDNFDRQAATHLALIFGPPGATRFALARDLLPRGAMVGEYRWR